MRLKRIFFMLLGYIAFNWFISALEAMAENAPNNPPVVTITSPLDNSRFQWNAMVNYTISVADQEDGLSVYDEITPGEVLLKVIYLPDSGQLKAYLSNDEDNEPAGLSIMIKSACFSCHHAKDKLIGPSFQAIAGRYASNSGAVEMLADKLIKGSTGTWGNVPMPAQPHLTPVQAKEVMRWILNNNRDPDVTYLTGIQGAFRTRQKPEKATGKEVYVLTASYTDHGSKSKAQLPKRGHHTIILRINNDFLRVSDSINL